ncbi:MAG TPA: hypothetical protein VN767_06290 [Streptosporangiaceae bacterium]|nr:hypothetical protein [Streptosporangiaceae bacterium]
MKFRPARRAGLRVLAVFGPGMRTKDRRPGRVAWSGAEPAARHQDGLAHGTRSGWRTVPAAAALTRGSSADPRPPQLAKDMRQR